MDGTNISSINDFLNFSEILKSKYEKCNMETKKLFIELLNRISKFCSEYSSIEMKEYHFRFQKRYKGGRGKQYQNFCLFTLTPSKNGITIHLRTDNVKVTSKVISLSIMNDCTYLSGKTWVKFGVYNIDQLNEAIYLISRIYELDNE